MSRSWHGEMNAVARLDVSTELHLNKVQCWVRSNRPHRPIVVDFWFKLDIFLRRNEIHVREKIFILLNLPSQIANASCKFDNRLTVFRLLRVERHSQKIIEWMFVGQQKGVFAKYIAGVF